MMNAEPVPQIFDRRLIRLRRQLCAKRFGDHDFLHRRAMEDIVDRLETIKRNFTNACFHGVGDAHDQLTPACDVGHIVHCDSAVGRLGNGVGERVVFDEEAMPFADRSFDLIVSLLTLHSVNDLIGSLIQYRRLLRPDGLFLAAVFSGDTLAAAKKSFYEAEANLKGGVSARFHPLADVRQWGNALSRAGFALPVTDIDRVSVRYENSMSLIGDLRSMGEARALTSKAGPLSRSVAMMALNQISKPVEFEIAFLTAWAPHPAQPKPLKPGAGKVSMSGIFDKQMPKKG